MNKFEILVGNNGNDVLKRRASNLADTALLSQQSLINVLEAKKAETEGKIINLTDLAPTSKDSLSPGVKDFNANAWVETLQALKLELYRLNISINLAKDTFAEYFEDKKEDKKTDKKSDTDDKK